MMHKWFLTPETMRRRMLWLGKAGESGHLALIFDVSAWMDAYPDAVIELYVTPPAGDAYMALLQESEDGLVWLLTAADTAEPGAGSIELIMRNPSSGVVLKSATAGTHVEASPSQAAPGEPPKAHEPWWERVLQLIAAGGGGNGGVSPTITVEAIAGGHRVTITDVLGTKTMDVMDGEDGKNGSDGKNGVSPTVGITSITGGHRVTITDAQGTKSFDVMNGKDGSGGNGNAGDVTGQIENYLAQNSQDIAVLTINLGGTIYTYNGSTAVTITIEDGDSKAY